MGRKGSWLSAIRRVFTPKSSSKDKLITGTENRPSQEKKKGRRRLKHGEFKSFIPLFRKPSSIEKILGEADEQKLFVPLYSEHQKVTCERPKQAGSSHFTPPREASARGASPKHAGSSHFAPPREASPKGASLNQAGSSHFAPPREASPKDASLNQAGSSHSTPLKEASPRGASLNQTGSSHSTPPKEAYPRDASPNQAGSSHFTPPREASPRGSSPKHSALKVSSQQAGSSHNAPPKPTSPRVASSVVNHVHRAEPSLEVLHLSATKIQAIFRGYMARKSLRSLRGLLRLQGVVRGNNVKRQTANTMKQMQLFVRMQNQIRLRKIGMLGNQEPQWLACKSYKDGESILSKSSLWSEAGNNDNWDGSRLTKDQVDERRRRKVEASMKRERAMAYAYSHKLWGASPKSTMSNRSNTNPLHGNLETDTPTSTKSSVPMRGSFFHFTPQHSTQRKPVHSGASTAGSTSRFPMKDSDSLTSCPSFSVPNYMTPTISAIAKARPGGNVREGSVGSSHSVRRLSFPLTPSVGSLKWNRGSGRGDGSADRMSVSSAVSMPATVGRKLF